MLPRGSKVLKLSSINELKELRKVLFDTSDGEWSTVRFPFEDFLPVFRGQILEYESPMDASQIQQVGFLLNDKKAGPFSLEIDFVRTW